MQYLGGKWWGGYAKNAAGQDYCGASKRSILRKMEGCKDVDFLACDYSWHNPEGMLIYCDPPYQHTTGYNGVPKFDHEKFWETVRKWSQNNIVLISEYTAPDDFECVLEIETALDMQSNGDKKRIERVFRIKNGLCK